MKPTRKRKILYILASVSFLFGAALMKIYSAVRFTGFLFCLAAGVIALWAVCDKWSEKTRAGVIAKRALSVLLVLGALLFATLDDSEKQQLMNLMTKLHEHWESCTFERRNANE